MSAQPRRYTKYRRRTALIALCYALLRNHANRMGVSSDEVPMLDYDATKMECTIVFRSFERELAKTLRVDIAVIRTSRGYHLVPLMTLYPKGRALAQLSSLKAYAENLMKRGITPRILPGEVDAVIRVLSSIENPTMFFDDFYRWILREFDVYIRMGCLDAAHIDATLRRRYTTLRISGKECRPYDIRFDHFMTPEGVPIAVDPITYLYGMSPTFRCTDFRRVVDIVISNVRHRYPWVRREALERLRRFLLAVATAQT